MGIIQYGVVVVYPYLCQLQNHVSVWLHIKQLNSRC